MTTETVELSTWKKFAASLADSNVQLPLKIADDDDATLVDANGRNVLTVDVNRERSDVEAWKIALWVALAMNTCGGFKLETEGVSHG